MRYLGIDYGLRSTGLALGDDDAKIAHAIEEVDTAKVLKRIGEVIQEDGVEAIVLGVPYSDRGNKEQEELTLTFAKELEVFGLPIHLVDEANTSAESIRIQKETGTKEGKDALAAMLILQDYFSR